MLPNCNYQKLMTRFILPFNRKVYWPTFQRAYFLFYINVILLVILYSQSLIQSKNFMKYVALSIILVTVHKKKNITRWPTHKWPYLLSLQTNKGVTVSSREKIISAHLYSHGNNIFFLTNFVDVENWHYIWYK